MQIIDWLLKDLSPEGLIALIIIIVILLRSVKQFSFYILFTLPNKFKTIIRDGDINACTHPGRKYERGIVFCNQCPAILGTYPYEHKPNTRRTKKNSIQRVFKNGSGSKKKTITSKKIRTSKKRSTSEMEKN